MLKSDVRLFPKKSQYQSSTFRLLSATPDMISKVKRLVDRENPASHRHIQRETKLSLSSINKVIHQDL